MPKLASYLHQKYMKADHYKTLYMKHLRTSTQCQAPEDVWKQLQEVGRISVTAVFDNTMVVYVGSTFISVWSLLPKEYKHSNIGICDIVLFKRT